MWMSAFAAFSYTLGYFIASTASAEDIVMCFWDGVWLLEEAGFVVVAATIDGPPSKQEISGR